MMTSQQAPRTENGQQEQPPSSWRPINLTEVLTGNWQPPQPTVGQRTDLKGLLYPGKTHTGIGETESGKGWFALSIAADEIAAGNDVLYIDFEDDEGSVIGRLLTLGIQRTRIGSGFHYLRPEHPLIGRHERELADRMHEYQPTLAVLDGITEAMTLHGYNPLDNMDIAKFNTNVVRKLTFTGAAELSLDHVTKARDGRDKYALGGVHKLNIVSGAGYILENRQPFGIGITGKSTIRIAKDRPGQLRVNALPSSNSQHWYGDLVLASRGGDFAEVSIEPPHQRDESFRPVQLMAKITEALGKAAQPISQRQLLALIPGRDATKRAAFALLVAEGYISGKSPHTLIKPYAEGR
jgi:hypothetical protein